jgi:UDP-glucose 4-epimerase
LLRLIDTESAYGHVFNIGSNQETSINGLAELVRERSGSSSALAHIPYDQAYDPGFEDLQRRVPDVSKLENAIGIYPQTPIATIVERVVEYTRCGQPT